MRTGLSLKEIAETIGVSQTYAGQAIDPALTKVSMLFARYPAETMRMIADRSQELARDEGPMPRTLSEGEFKLRQEAARR